MNAGPEEKSRRTQEQGAVRILNKTDLRVARPGVHDAESFQRMRMEDYFMDVPVFDAFDAIAYVTHTSVSEMER